MRINELQGAPFRSKMWVMNRGWRGPKSMRCDPDGRLIWESAKTRDHRDRQRHEHREILLILQGAVIKIAESDADLASKLAATAYVTPENRTPGPASL